MLRNLKIFMPILVRSSEENLLSELLLSIDKTNERISGKGDITYEIFDGVSSMQEVFPRREEIIQAIPEEYTHVLFMDPDDLLSPDGFLSALDEMEGYDGILLQEETFIVRFVMRYRHCCKLMLPVNTAKEFSKRTLAKGLTDREHAIEASRELNIINSSQPVVFSRARKDTVTPDDIIVRIIGEH